MCSPAMVLVVHAPVICLVEDLMVACGKRADDTLCLLAPTRRWCCQQPKKNDGSHFCYLTKQTLQKREALVQQENVVQDNSVVKTQSSNPIQNSNGKIHMQSKAKSFWFINLHQKAKFLHSFRTKATPFKPLSDTFTQIHGTQQMTYFLFLFTAITLGRKSGLILNKVSFNACKLKPNTCFVHTFLRSSSFSIGSTAQHGLAVSV